MNSPGNTRLDPKEKVLRYCRKKKVVRETGKAHPSAFILEEKDKGYLSVNWLGKYANCSEEKQVRKCQNAYFTKMEKRGMIFSDTNKKASRFAVIPVGITEKHLATEMQLAIETWGFNHHGDPSHAGIFKLPENDLKTAELIFNMTEIHYPGVF